MSYNSHMLQRNEPLVESITCACSDRDAPRCVATQLHVRQGYVSLLHSSQQTTPVHSSLFGSVSRALPSPHSTAHTGSQPSQRELLRHPASSSPGSRLAIRETPAETRESLLRLGGSEPRPLCLQAGATINSSGGEFFVFTFNSTHLSSQATPAPRTDSPRTPHADGMRRGRDGVAFDASRSRTAQRPPPTHA
jgi:hypothetical protein